MKAWGDGKIPSARIGKKGYGYWLETSQILNGVSQIILHAQLKDPIKNVSDLEKVMSLLSADDLVMLENT